ncbi:hypothetical protein N790_02405 [Arenimonas malthae CC-JY-1]|uniref:Uncharacterized protein n=1 Tax=Arenimonas malthae CC-JY-1 TaxID=1384054 RepID=A0A091B1E9_9GAMM|nr:hypothetical protein N790_02405 [Arenimonas malthae CC-JY-1]
MHEVSDAHLAWGREIQTQCLSRFGATLGLQQGAGQQALARQPQGGVSRR